MMRRSYGQSIIEYAIILGLIVLIGAAGLVLFGGGIENVFRRTTNALSEKESTPTAGPTPTPNAYTFTCSSDFVLSGPDGVEFSCAMPAEIVELAGIETVRLSVNPALPDFHVVVFKFPTLKETRFFCGAGGCRGYAGPTTGLYPFSKTSEVLSADGSDSMQLDNWMVKSVKGHANYYQLNGDSNRAGAWALTVPVEPWAGALHITVVGKPVGAGGKQDEAVRDAP